MNSILTDERAWRPVLRNFCLTEFCGGACQTTSKVCLGETDLLDLQQFTDHFTVIECGDWSAGVVEEVHVRIDA